MSSATSSSSKFDNSDASDTEKAKRRRKRRKQKTRQKVKSGKLAKVSSYVVRSERWPHVFLSPVFGAKTDIKYDDLSIEQFVGGYSRILVQPDISQPEKEARINHLSHLMDLAGTYQWKAVLCFHSHCLMEIERGVLQWGDSFTHLEGVSLSPATVLRQKSTQNHHSPSAGAGANSVPLYYHDYQKGECSSPGDHHGWFMGRRRFMQHVCKACQVNGRPNERHPENSDDCPVKSQ